MVPVTIIYLQPRAPDFAHVYFYKAKNRINYVAVQGRSKAERELQHSNCHLHSDISYNVNNQRKKLFFGLHAMAFEDGLKNIARITRN